MALFDLESRGQHYDALADSKRLKPSCQQPHVRSLVSSEYLCHVYVRSDSLAGVVIADSEYPSRVAFTLLEKVSVLWTRLGWQVGNMVDPVPEAQGVIGPEATFSVIISPKTRRHLKSLPIYIYFLLGANSALHATGLLYLSSE